MAFDSFLLVFYTIFLFSISRGWGTDDSEFLFLTSKDNVISCVTNSYKPLFWTAAKKDENDQLDQQVSTFTRYRPSSPVVNCDFDLSENCTHLWTRPDSPWKSSNSLDLNLYVSLLDFRWENLELIESGKNRYGRTSSRTFNNSSFEIGISFRLKHQGHIFFCESSADANRTENCHAFIIQVDHSSLRSFSAKCDNDLQLDVEFNVTQQCSDVSEVEVVKNREIFLLESLKSDAEPDKDYGTFWAHVKLSKNDERVELQLTDDEFDLAIAEFTDRSFSSDLQKNYVVLLGSNSDGDLWKFHDYQFIYTTEVVKNFRLQPALKRENSSEICMFVYLCSTCFLRIRMVSVETGDVYKPSDYYQTSSTSNWAQIVYNASVMAEEYYLEISTLKSANCSGFWGIDHVRYCHDFEYRMLELPKSLKKQGAKCELVPKTRPKTKNLHEVMIEPHNFTYAENCTENTLGSICLPCEFIYNQSNCSGIGVCENDVGTEVCYCAGFGTKLEKELCAANMIVPIESSTDGQKDSKATGYIFDTRLNDVIFVLGITFAGILLFVLILFVVLRKVRKTYETGEGITPDLIQTSQLPSYKRLLSGRRKTITKIVRKPVPIEHFENYVQEIVRSGEINDQLEGLIPQQRLYSVIRGPVNSGYEKPVDIIFADSYKSPKSFVIFQGKETIQPQDFWHNVFKKDVKNIVWIAMDEKVKLWPGLNENWNVNGISIATVLVQTNRTTLKLKDDQDTEKIIRLDLILWETHIPLCSQKLSTVCLELLKVSPSSKSPILIFNNTSDLNKSATVLLCDSCLRMVAQEGLVDIQGQLKALTNQIPPLFANFKYYSLVHYTVLESLIHFDTEIDCQELDGVIDKDLYKLQIRHVQSLLPDSSKKVLKEHQVRTHVYDNFPDLSAVYVNGFRACKKFIVAPQPLRAYFEEFWELVVEFEVSLIVTLNQHNNKFMQNSNVAFVKTEAFNNYEVFVGSMNEKPITVVCLLNWPFTEPLPRNLENFIEFFEKSISISTNSKKMLVVCRDGVDAAGVYVALSYLIEQMKAAKLCDVPKAIQNARRSKTEFVRKKSQVKFLYRAANAYVQMFPEKLAK